MRLKRLVTKNFRCFEALEVELEKTNLFVGENGTGKTAALEAIHLALTPSYVNSRLKYDDFRKDKDVDSFEIKLYLEEPFIANLPDGYDTKPIPCVGVYLSAKAREKAAPRKALSNEFTVTHCAIPDESDENLKRTEKGWEIKRKNSKYPFKFDLRRLSFPLATEDLPGCFYFDKKRESQSKVGFNSTLQHLAQEYNWRFRKGIGDSLNDLKSNWNAFYETSIGAVDKKKLKSTFEPVKQKLENFLGTDPQNLELSLMAIMEPFSKMFFALRNGTHQISQNNMGSGISMLISFFLLETISSLAGESLVYLIDEPELHLHPQIRNKLGDFFTQSTHQVIVSTHSPELINVGEWTTIKRFDKCGKCYPTEQRLQESIIYNKKQEPLADALNDIRKFHKDKTLFLRENNQLFFARRVVLTEGPVDRYAVITLGEKAGLNVSELTVIACHGKSKICWYQCVCKAFEIPYFTLYDTDTGDNNDGAHNSNIEALQLGEHAYAFSDSLESCFGIGKNNDRKGFATIETIDNIEELPSEFNTALDQIKKFANVASDTFFCEELPTVEIKAAGNA